LKKIQNPYLKKRIKEIKSTWQRLFFGPWGNFVTIMDYKDAAGQITPELASSNIHRISRDYTNNIKFGLHEMQFVINHLGKKYKQEIIDSNELTNLFEELLEIGSWSYQTNIEKYGIASNLFLISLKILIEKAPLSLQRKLGNLMVDFIDLYNLPMELGSKEAKALIKPTFYYDVNGYVRIELDRK